METVHLECKNCGAALPVPEGLAFVECEFCHTAHRVSRSSDGSVDLTMLEEAVREVGRDVKSVDGKTEQLLGIHRSMAQKENARLQLNELKERYRRSMRDFNQENTEVIEELEREEQDLRGKLREASETGYKILLLGLGLLGVVVAVAVVASSIGKSVSDLGALFAIFGLAGVVCIGLTVYQFKEIARLRSEFKAKKKKAENALSARKRDIEVGFNKEAQSLQEILERVIEV